MRGRQRRSRLTPAAFSPRWPALASAPARTRSHRTCPRNAEGRSAHAQAPRRGRVRGFVPVLCPSVLCPSVLCAPVFYAPLRCTPVLSAPVPAPPILSAPVVSSTALSAPVLFTAFSSA